MRNTQLSFECAPRAKSNLTSSPRSSRRREFMGTRKSRLGGGSKENFSSIRSQQPIQTHAKSENYLSFISDPLWQYVCRDFIQMMGAESFLKIWKSTLGEIGSQNQSIDIYCQTEEIAQFVQQYDFVILGSLHPYFPALKQLRVRHNSQ